MACATEPPETERTHPPCSRAFAVASIREMGTALYSLNGFENIAKGGGRLVVEGVGVEAPHAADVHHNGPQSGFGAARGNTCRVDAITPYLIWGKEKEKPEKHQCTTAT